MNDTIYRTIFLNNFTKTPEEMGITVKDGKGSINGQTLELVEVRGNKLSHWSLNNEHLLDWDQFSAKDVKRGQNFSLLQSKIGVSSAHGAEEVN